MNRTEIEELKNKNDIIAVAQRLGLPVTKYGDRCVSLAPDSHNPTALCINDGWWYDFKTGKGGDVIALVMEASKCDFNDAIKFLGGDSKDYTQSVKINEQIKKWHADLLKDEDMLKYLREERGMSDETIKRFQLGIGFVDIYDGKGTKEKRLIIPYLLKSGFGTYYTSRRIEWLKNKSDKKYIKPGQKQTGLQSQILGLDTLKINGNDLWLDEGIFDHLSLAQAGEASLCSSGGFSGKKHIDTIMQYAKVAETIFLGFDSDDAGKNFTEKMAWNLLKSRIKRVLYIPSYGNEMKDINDYFVSGGNVNDLKSKARSAYVFLAGRIKTFDEARDFLKRLKFLVGPSELKEAKKEIFKNFKAYEDEITKICKFSKDQYHRDLLEEFLQERRILHCGEGGIAGSYYEYDLNYGYWKEKKTSDIEQELANMHNEQLNTGDVRTLEKMLRQHKDVHVEDMPDFNSKHLMKFLNGTLELDTELFRENRPEDYISHKGTVLYNAEADSPIFKNFLATSLTESNRETLNDLLGYTLYPDNSLHKMFYLIGKAGSGKSTFSDMLRDIYGIECTSSLEPKDFSRDDYLAKFAHSILNISDDIDYTNWPRERINSIISGNTILVRELYKAPWNLRPRTKLIMAGNDIPQPKRKDEGLLRRICFIEFSFEGVKDTNLASKLASERSGIFNYIFQCYKDLKERNGQIRENVSNSKYLKELEENSDIVMSFWDSEHDSLIKEECEVPAQYLFEKFADYSKNVYGQPARMNIRKFNKEFQDILNKQGVVFDYKVFKGYENKAVRGYVFKQEQPI